MSNILHRKNKSVDLESVLKWKMNNICSKLQSNIFQYICPYNTVDERLWCRGPRHIQTAASAVSMVPPHLGHREDEGLAKVPLSPEKASGLMSPNYREEENPTLQNQRRRRKKKQFLKRFPTACFTSPCSQQEAQQE